VANNNASQDGGAIYNEGTLTLDNTTIAVNYADRGGGIFNSGTLYVQFDSLIVSNEAIHDGGGIYNSSTGTASISLSTIGSNTAGSPAFANSGRGGGIFNRGVLSISNSTLSYNGAWQQGGALFLATGVQNNPSSATLSSVIINYNWATGPLGAGWGGGFCVQADASLSAANCTLVSNIATDDNSRGGYVEEDAVDSYSWSGPLPDDPVFLEGIA
jgi:predicted outer membrane repeat protein